MQFPDSHAISSQRSFQLLRRGGAGELLFGSKVIAHCSGEGVRVNCFSGQRSKSGGENAGLFVSTLNLWNILEHSVRSKVKKWRENAGLFVSTLIHHLDPPSRSTLSIHPLDPPSRSTLSIHPLDPPSRSGQLKPIKKARISDFFVIWKIFLLESSSIRSCLNEDY